MSRSFNRTLAPDLRLSASSRRVLLLALGAGTLFASGCVNDLNRRPSLPQPTPLASIDGAAVPGVRGPIRADWQRITVAAAASGVEHQPHYRTEIHIGEPPHRDRGFYPTIESASDDSIDHGQAALEGVVAVPLAAFDLLAAPFRMFITPPWTAVRGGPTYEREPRFAAE